MHCDRAASACDATAGGARTHPCRYRRYMPAYLHGAKIGAIARSLWRRSTLALEFARWAAAGSVSAYARCMGVARRCGPFDDV